MRIRKFYEQEEQLRLSSETLNEMMTKLKDISDSFENNQKILKSLCATLSNFESNSKVSNTQLDDASVNLRTIDTMISNISSLLETANKQMKNYYDGTGETKNFGFDETKTDLL